ncbi:PRD domain-containing protein, partial [Desulfovibrio desulfuricans]|nr:PRD domain-containing protein [Desulfovibrio desulfuricans]
QKNTEYIHNLVANILDSIFESYHFDLRSDLILEHDLTHHLQSILNARYYNLNKQNPLLNTIRNNYILAYEISGTAIKQAFANEPFELSE